MKNAAFQHQRQAIDALRGFGMNRLIYQRVDQTCISLDRIVTGA